MIIIPVIINIILSIPMGAQVEHIYSDFLVNKWVYPILLALFDFIFSILVSSFYPYSYRLNIY